VTERRELTVVHLELDTVDVTTMKDLYPREIPAGWVTATLSDGSLSTWIRRKFGEHPELGSKVTVEVDA
jgi:hypothetical protein